MALGLEELRPVRASLPGLALTHGVVRVGAFAHVVGRRVWVRHHVVGVVVERLHPTGIHKEDVSASLVQVAGAGLHLDVGGRERTGLLHQLVPVPKF